MTAGWEPVHIIKKITSKLQDNQDNFANDIWTEPWAYHLEILPEEEGACNGQRPVISNMAAAVDNKLIILSFILW